MTWLIWIASIAVIAVAALLGYARGIGDGLAAIPEDDDTDDVTAQERAAAAFDRGFAEGRKLSADILSASETVAKVALDSANSARAATLQRDEMAALLNDARGRLHAATQALADNSARIDLMDEDLRTIYSGFEQARIVAPRGGDANRFRQHGEPDLNSGPPRLKHTTEEPRQN